MPPKTKTSITVTARMETGLKERIDDAAAKTGRSISAEIIHRLEAYERHERAFQLLSDNAEARRVCRIIADMAALIDEQNPPVTGGITIGAPQPDNAARAKYLHDTLVSYFADPNRQDFYGASGIAAQVREFYEPVASQIDFHVEKAFQYTEVVKVISSEYSADLAATAARDHAAAAAKAMDAAKNAGEAREARFAELCESIESLPPPLSPEDREKLQPSVSDMLRNVQLAEAIRKRIKAPE